MLSILRSAAGAVCMLPQPRLVCAEYFREQVVVIARLTRVHYVQPKDENAIDYHLYSMEAERVLHGQIPRRFRIYEENSSGRAGFDWEPGQRYLLFLSYYRQDGGWGLDGCGNSALLEHSAGALREIEKIKTAQPQDGGYISGNVSAHAGVAVIAQGNRGTFRTRSGDDTSFRLHVPAGTYRVRAVKPGVRFTGYDLSYELPPRVRIENGGCAQIVFDQVDLKDRRYPSERLPGR